MPQIVKKPMIIGSRRGKMLLCCILRIVCCLSILRLHVIPRIMINDELQSRLWYMQGVEPFLKHFSSEQLLEKGRGISIFSIPMNMLIGFIGTYNGLFKWIQTAVIILDIVCMALLLQRIMGHWICSALFAITTLCFLPINFEHTAPNAYVTLYGVPFALMIVSCMLFVRNLKRKENQPRKHIKTIIVLLFYALTSYEAFVTLVLAYLLLAFFFSDGSSMVVRLKAAIWESREIIGTVFVYLAAFLTVRLLYPSLYGGNTVGFTLHGAFQIVGQLILSCLPGYYLFNSKYRYLTELYGGNSILKLISTTDILFAVMIAAVIYCCLSSEKKSDWRKGLAAGCGCLMCGILPSIPIAVASSYQGCVNAEDYIALPVSYFMYFLMMAGISVFISATIRRMPKGTGILLALAIGFAGMLVQIDNRVFVAEQSDNYIRLQSIEDFVRSGELTIYEGKRVSAPSFYETKNALAIHSGYWTDYACVNGINVEIVPDKENCAAMIDYDGFEFRITELE